MPPEVVIPKPDSSDEHEDECQCIHCGLDYDFDLPEELVYAAHGRDVVIFAGAGVSTEVPTVFPETIMAAAAERLGLGEPGSFPEVIQAFVDKYGRTEFVQMVKAKFDYIDSFWGLRYDARKFHRELATMPYLQDIVTTNWDTFFEEECDATPFVTGEDIALWNMPGRRVLKIHGSMTNLGSIVATESDYQERLDELGTNVMGALLKNLLVTKTVVFVGYSLKDWNFRRLYEKLLEDMGSFSPRAYFVSPFGADAEDEKKFGLKTFKTSGVKFLRDLKAANLGSCFIEDAAYDRISEYEDAILDADLFAKTVPHKKYPSVLYCWSFHDGARDACGRIRYRRGSGEYSSRQFIRNRIRTYEMLSDQAWESGRYWDHAYIEGYVTVLYLMFDDQEVDGEKYKLFETAPFFFMYGADSDSTMRTQEEFREAVEASNRRAPKPRKVAKERLKGIPGDMVLTHAPFLPGLRTENDFVEDEHGGN